MIRHRECRSSTKLSFCCRKWFDNNSIKWELELLALVIRRLDQFHQSQMGSFQTSLQITRLTINNLTYFFSGSGENLGLLSKHVRQDLLRIWKLTFSREKWKTSRNGKMDRIDNFLHFKIKDFSKISFITFSFLLTKTSTLFQWHTDWFSVHLA